MKVRPLIVNEDIIKRIAVAVELARRHIVPMSLLRKHAASIEGAGGFLKDVTLADRHPGVDEAVNRPVGVSIPIGYRVALSFEEQPAGIMRHLSISVAQRKRMPSKESVDAILTLFGFAPLWAGTSTVWLEEFEPNHQAVNVLQFVSETPEGHA